MGSLLENIIVGGLTSAYLLTISPLPLAQTQATMSGGAAKIMRGWNVRFHFGIESAQEWGNHGQQSSRI
jgi:hypothetical protein